MNEFLTVERQLKKSQFLFNTGTDFDNRNIHFGEIVATELIRISLNYICDLVENEKDH